MMAVEAGRCEPIRIAILGGGISGLAAALWLDHHRPEWEVDLLDASDALGGCLRTTQRDGYLIEHAADNFLADPQNPWALHLCRRYGLDDQLLQTDPRFRRAIVVRQGRLHVIPEGFRLMLPGQWLPLFRSRLLSWPGKLRLMAEPLIPARRGDQDETLREFAQRRLGREAYTWLVQPLVSGIYSADPDRLSIDAALPQFRRWEQQYGSLTRAAQAMRKKREAGASAAAAGGSLPSGQAAEADGSSGSSGQSLSDTARPGESRTESGARYGQFLGPRHGMQRLVESLAGQLRRARILCAHRVVGLRPASGHWQVELAGSSAPSRYAAVVVALPAPVAGSIAAGFDRRLGEELCAIEHASSAIVCLGYSMEQVRRPLDAFGLVVPEAEGRPVFAISLSSIKFPGRAPEGHVLMRVFMGGARHPEILEHSDSELARIAQSEVASLLGVQGAPDLAMVVRWNHMMPQFHVGHRQRIERIEQCLGRWRGLALAGNYFTGVGIPHCVRRGELAAERIASQLAGGADGDGASAA